MATVPEVSRFYGIVITINYDDHPPPHFHARYGEDRASITMQGMLLAGSLPPRTLALVRAWAELHRGELMDDWELARNQSPLEPIAPLE